MSCVGCIIDIVFGIVWAGGEDFTISRVYIVLATLRVPKHVRENQDNAITHTNNVESFPTLGFNPFAIDVRFVFKELRIAQLSRSELWKFTPRSIAVAYLER
jgi:hypothetical protein